MNDSAVINLAAEAYVKSSFWKTGDGPKAKTADAIISEHVDYTTEPTRWHRLASTTCARAEKQLLKYVPYKRCRYCERDVPKIGCRSRADYRFRKICSHCRGKMTRCPGCGMGFRAKRPDRNEFHSRSCYNKWYARTGQGRKNVLRNKKRARFGEGLPVEAV